MRVCCGGFSILVLVSEPTQQRNPLHFWLVKGAASSGADGNGAADPNRIGSSSGRETAWISTPVDGAVRGKRPIPINKETPHQILNTSMAHTLTQLGLHEWLQILWSLD